MRPQNEETARQPGSNTSGFRRHQQDTPSQTRHQLSPLGRDETAVTCDEFAGYPVLIDAETAAELLSLALRTVSKHTASGAIPSLKIGKSRRYRTAELLAWLDADCPTEANAGDEIRARMRGGAA